MTAWRKSSYTTGGGGTTECVEVAEIADTGGLPEDVIVLQSLNHSFNAR